MRRPRERDLEQAEAERPSFSGPADERKSFFRLGRQARNVATCLAGFGIATVLAGSALVWSHWDIGADLHADLGEGLPTQPPVPKQSDPDPGLASSAPPPDVTSAPPPATSSSSKTGEFDALLDELLGLHRNDVKEREVAPEDLPVYHTDLALVATMADGGFATCAIRLVQSARDAGRWGGAVVVLVPVGEGTVPLQPGDVSQLEKLGARLLEVGPEIAGGSEVRGAGSAAQYAKVRLLVDEQFRKYETVLYLDADGAVGAPLQPLLDAALPSGRVAAMPTWPSAKVKHESFYTREINKKAITSEAMDRLRASCPDRTLVGITAWFLVKPRLLPEPAAMRVTVDEALELWRPAFRFNDQGLWNAIFYNTSAFYPLCVSGPVPGKVGRGPFSPFLVDGLEALGETIDEVCGPSQERRRPLYQHPLKDCIPQEQWERQMAKNRALSQKQRKDISEAYDRTESAGGRERAERKRKRRRSQESETGHERAKRRHEREGKRKQKEA